MKPGTIIAGVGITAGVVALGYFGYKKFATPSAASSAPSGGNTLVPAGNNPSTGVQQYLNTAGDIVDAAGAIINTIKPVQTPGTTLTDTNGNTFSLSTATESGGYQILVNGVHKGGGIKLFQQNGSTYHENKKGETWRWNQSSMYWDKVPGVSGLRGLGAVAAYKMLN